MKVGVDTKAPLSKFYSQDVIDALTSGADNLSRWAIPQGQGDLLGAIQGDAARGRRRQRGGQRDQRRGRGQEGGRRDPSGSVAVQHQRTDEPGGRDRAGARPAARTTGHGAPAGPVRPGPRGPAGGLPADLAHRGHRLRDGGAADPVDGLAGVPARPAAQPAHHRASSGTTASTTSRRCSPRPGSSTPWSPRWSTPSSGPPARSASGWSPRWRCGRPSGAGGWSARAC